ncbi:MAG: indole-3-glycerol phosphate synthase TrpC [Bacteroidales bacterium]|nr:indole-3-glycerol phosphate synthase TrpC [Bacteroidales bacterium]
MNILHKIVETKRAEVAAAKKVISPAIMAELAAAVTRPTASLAKSIMEKETGIISEFKRRSPSKGEIRPMAQVTDIIPGYSAAGAAGISVLTDTPYFGGALTDLATARSLTCTPLLRKEFIIDDYQIMEARVAGADAILLIAAILNDEEIAKFIATAHSLGLEVLFETHNEEEAARIPHGVDLVGVNSRNLNSFETSLDVARRMIDKLPANAVKIAESGIHSPGDIAMLKGAGFDGFLIGEAFMSTPSPAETLKTYLK